MAKFQVTVEREVSEEGYLLIEADSPEEAFKKAEKFPALAFSWDRVETGPHWPSHVEPEDEEGG